MEVVYCNRGRAGYHFVCRMFQDFQEFSETILPATRKKKADGRVVLFVKVDPDLRRRFKAAVAYEGLTIEEKVERLMLQTVESTPVCHPATAGA